MERLQKVMAERGIASRRKSEELILAGKVRVNGKVITELGYKVDPVNDVIQVGDDDFVHKQKKIYVLLNKPLKVITSVSDPRGRKTVIDLVSNIHERIYPVGRLDYDTEGLILLTNDGELAYRMTHPSFELDKEYVATVQGTPSEKSLQLLRNGIELEDGLTAPAIVHIIGKDKKGNSILQLVIHEGRNRQVRRMCAAIGHPVLHLMRRRIGFLTLDKLQSGEYRHLQHAEVLQLKKLLKLV